ncbi:MAG: S8 family serine peptidase [Planctomycetota bacterium]|jgi:subtilisin family serine protease
MKRLATLGGVVICLLAGQAQAGDVAPGLAAAIQQTPPDEVISTLVYLADRVDLAATTHQLDLQRATLKTRHEVVVRALQDKAAATQGDLTAHLDALLAQGRIRRFDAFWIDNIIRVDAVAREIELIAQRPDVDRVYINYEIETIAPVEEHPAPGGAALAVEPGVAAVRAPEVWALGITGQTTLVATLDTGVDGTHPALASRWRGNDPAYAGHPEWAWFDPVPPGTTFPTAFGSHGTHTMGTVCGGPPGDEVGVAPGAEWIHAAVIDRVSIDQTIADSLLAFQWMVDPDGDPGTNFDVPDVCSNSWGLADVHGVPDCDQTFWSHLDACEAAGIVILFSAGNEGFSGLRRPADRATDDYRTCAVAAVDGNVSSWPIASFSSRGPTLCTPTGDPAIKPDIAAPGVSVRSSVPGGSYGNFSGTSMASPHVNGVVALMREANPDIAVEQVKQIIYDTAFDLGLPGEDNDYGWGMVDAFEAVQQALGSVSLTFTFPDGRPDVFDPLGGTTIRVNVSGTAVDPVPGTGMVYYSTGGPFTSAAMNEPAPNEYEAVFPPFDCLADVSYYFSADADSGDTVYSPFSAPAATYSAEVYSGIAYDYQDDFETDQGWTVQDDPGLTTGSWERGVPAGGGDRGDPAADADGSGQCYVTGLADGDNDIDDGATTLTSPIMDATDLDMSIGYWRWYSNTFGADPQNDIFLVDVSDDGGLIWVNLETVGPAGPEVGGGWIRKEFLIREIPGINNTGQFRIRFTASDLNAGSVVEAGVDGVEILKLFCDTGECPDIDGDGEVSVLDFLELLAAWGPNPGHPADLNGDGEVDVQDFLILLAGWGPCP